MSQVNSKTGAIDLDHQGQIGLQTSTSLKKFKNSFLYPIKLKLCIDHLLAPSRQFLGAGGGRHLFFTNSRKVIQVGLLLCFSNKLVSQVGFLFSILVKCISESLVHCVSHYLMAINLLK